MEKNYNVTEQDKAFMREAIRLANESCENGGGPFGAVIVKDGEIVAGASNSVTIDNDPTAHAEVNAIRKACKKLGTFDLTGCVVYTSCEPCPLCLGALYWAHIKKIYYGNSKKDAADIDFDDDFIAARLDRRHQAGIKSDKVIMAAGFLKSLPNSGKRQHPFGV